MVKTYQKAAALLLALALIFALPVPASAAETTEARVPVTLTVVNTVAPISCTVPAALPVSLVDGYVVAANNAAITNTAKTGSIKVTKVMFRQARLKSAILTILRQARTASHLASMVVAQKAQGV